MSSNRSCPLVRIDGERFAIASGKDPKTGRYRDLIIPLDSNAYVHVTDHTLLVDFERAKQQVEADWITREREELEHATKEHGVSATYDTVLPSRGPRAESNVEGGSAAGPRTAPEAAAPSRFFGSVAIDPQRYSRDIGNVTREVIERLIGAGAELEITIDIQATKSGGFEESEVRTISENAQTLKFDPGSGFERT